MSDNIIQVNQEIIHTELKDLVRASVEEALNAMLGNIGSVGIGTIIAAILVGTVHGFITKILGEKRDIFLEN